MKKQINVTLLQEPQKIRKKTSRKKRNKRTIKISLLASIIQYKKETIPMGGAACHFSWLLLFHKLEII
jgi:hypothetical protein